MPERTCYACGTPAPAGAVFCRQCGRDLEPEGPEDAPTAEYVEPVSPQRSRRLLIGTILGTMLIGAIVGFVIVTLSEDKQKDAKTTTAAATPAVDPAVAANRRAVIDLDAALRLAKQGRTALGAKQLKAATANRQQVVKLLGSIHPPPGKVAAALVPLKAAFAYALMLDKTCGLSCPAAKNKRAAQLKVTALNAVNPLLKVGPGTHYGVGDI